MSRDRAEDERRLPSCGEQNKQEKLNFQKNEQNQNKVNGDRLLSVLVWYSVTVHTTGRTEEHEDEDVTQNNSL